MRRRGAPPSGRTSGRQSRRGAVPVPVSRRRRRRLRAATAEGAEVVEPPRVERRLPGRRGTGHARRRLAAEVPRLVRGGGSGGGGGGGGGGGTSIDGRRGGWERASGLAAGGFDGARGRAAGRSSKGWDDGFVARDGIARRKRVGLRGHVSGASNERCAVDSRRLGGFRGERARSGNGRGARGRRGTRLGDETRVDGRRRRGRVDRPRRRRGPRGERCRTSELLDAEGALHQSPELPHGADGWGVVVQPWTTPRIAGAERRRAKIHGRGTCESSRTHRPAAKDVRCDDVENSRREEHDTCASVRFGVARNATRI